MKERGIARHGYPIADESGAPVGVVTSGSVGPTVGANIGLGYVPAALAEPGTRLHVDCRGKSARRRESSTDPSTSVGQSQSEKRT